MATRNNKIIIKRSSVPAKVPLTTDLQLGELAINTNDGVLYFKKNDGVEAIVKSLEEAPSNSTLYARQDVGWQGIEDPVTAANTAVTGHVAQSDPHTQYLTAGELPSTIVGWYTDDVNTIDAAFLTTLNDTPTGPESTVQATGVTQGVPVLLGQWMRNDPFADSFTWFETNSSFQMDIDASNNNVELYLESWVRRANTSEELLVTTSPIQLEQTRQTYTFNVNIPGPIDIEVGDNVINRIYINQNDSGTDPVVTLFMEGGNVSRAITTVPIASFPAPHAVSHEVGGSDLINHDDLTNAQGFNSHSQIDTLLNEKLDSTSSVGDLIDADITGVADGNVLAWQTDKFVPVANSIEIGGYTEKVGTVNTIDASALNTNTISDGSTAVVINNVPIGAYTLTLVLVSGISTINLTGLSIKWPDGLEPTWTIGDDLIFLTTTNQGTSYLGSASTGHV